MYAISTGKAMQDELGAMSDKMYAKMDEIADAVSAIDQKLDRPQF
jgi:hypothetical protein